MMTPVHFTGLNTSRVAFAPDLDETSFKWKGSSGVAVGKDGKVRDKELENETQVRELNAFLDKNRDDVARIINTSNSLRSMKKLSHLFKDSPVDAMILANGKEVYLNPKEEPAETWIQSLETSDVDPQWAAALKNTSNFDKLAAKRIIRDTLLEEGYHGKPDDLNDPMYGQLPTGEAVELRFLESHAAFDLIVTLDKDSEPDVGKRESERLADLIEDNMETRVGMQVEQKALEFPGDEENQKLYIKDFGPTGFNKGSALQYVVRQMPNAEAVVSAGDNNFNDIQALKRHYYIHEDGSLLPNLPLAVKKSADFIRSIAGHPEVTYVAEGDLLDGFKKQLKKLDISG